MALVPMGQMLRDARKIKKAVGGFEFWSYDSARAVVAVAKKVGCPVILQVGHFERDYMDGYKNAYRIADMVSEHFRWPVAIHLDHAEDYDEVLAALDSGFTSVMIDGSMKPFAENVKLTKAVVELAAKYGATVEAELGVLGGAEGNIDRTDEQSCQTDPAQAARFVAETGVEALAVAIGTAHGFYKQTPVINIERLKQIAQAVEIPLVLHGGSGTPDAKVKEAIENGIAKVNICTEFIAAFGAGYTKSQQQADFKYNVDSLFVAARDNAQALVENKLALFRR